MTITYDPHHPKYFDEADVRDELTRVFDLCHGCRLCFKFCTSFPTLFEMIDRHDDQDAGRLTPAQQDQVVDECFQCKLCYVNCPYIPGPDEWAIDFPRLMLRADAMRHAERPGRRPRPSSPTQVLGRTDLHRQGSASPSAPVANKVARRQARLARRARSMEKTAGIVAACGCCRRSPGSGSPPGSRTPPAGAHRQARRASVAVFPTCLVEYQNPAIGQDLVKVYERNGIECSLRRRRQVCCGAPWLHSGDVDHFTEGRRKNVKALADAVRARQRHRRAPADVRLRAEEGLRRLRRWPRRRARRRAHLRRRRVPDEGAQGRRHDARHRLPPARSPTTVTYHTPCHLRAQNIGLKSRDLMKLTGARITLVQQCSGIDGMWGLRAENAEISVPIAKKLGRRDPQRGRRGRGRRLPPRQHRHHRADGREPLHPLQIIARAYGITEEVTHDDVD